MLNGISPASAPLFEVSPIFTGADVSYANLEIPLTSASTPTKRKSAAEIRARSQYILKANPAHIAALQQCGFKWVSLGNNHAMDYSLDGLRETTGLLQRAGIKYTGAGESATQASALAVHTLQKNGSPFRVGLLSFLAFQTPGGRYKCTPAGEGPGVATIELDKEQISRIVGDAKRKCDFLSVALHWGIEKKTVPSAYQVSLGRAWIDAGADLVIGSHPHVLQGAEVYKKKLIFYSLGNLVSPRPGATAVIVLDYLQDTAVGINVYSCYITGGKVSVRGIVKMKELSAVVQKYYPSADSAMPLFGLGVVTGKR